MREAKKRRANRWSWRGKKSATNVNKCLQHWNWQSQTFFGDVYVWALHWIGMELLFTFYTFELKSRIWTLIYTEIQSLIMYELTIYVFGLRFLLVITTFYYVKSTLFRTLIFFINNICFFSEALIWFGRDFI